MKNHLTLFLGVTLLALCLSACGWKPEVTAVPLTAPWTAMNLPVKDNAVVWKSEPNEFRAVHKDDKKTVLKNYTDTLKAQGWQLGKFDESGDRYTVEMSKSAEKIRLEFYDFNNTGVLIESGAALTDNPYYPTNTSSSNSSTTSTKSSSGTKAEKADFTVTAEQLDKEYTTKGAKKESLMKYANKNIAVTGRVSLLSLEKQGTTQPWVTLYAPGTLHGVSCYFDDDNLDQMKQLKMDKTVTVQGFQDDFIVPEVSPRLDHCVVLKADQ